MQTIAEKIRQRRLQMLVHSYIYYELDDNLVSDADWMRWANELKELQEANPEIASEVEYADAFKNWDASTGAYLPYKDKRIVKIATRLLNARKK